VEPGPDIQQLVGFLIEGNNMVVENYLNALGVNERSKVVEDMNNELTKQVSSI